MFNKTVMSGIRKYIHALTKSSSSYLSFDNAQAKSFPNFTRMPLMTLTILSFHLFIVHVMNSLKHTFKPAKSHQDFMTSRQNPSCRKKLYSFVCKGFYNFFRCPDILHRNILKHKNAILALSEIEGTLLHNTNVVISDMKF